MLTLRDLDVRFRAYEGLSYVLDGVNLHVLEGERVGLVGETGCGKTVAMKATMGILRSPPAQFPRGEILLNGRDVLRMKPSEILDMKGKVVSMIFQDPLTSLNPVFTIGQQIIDVIRFGRKRRVFSGRKQLRAIATEALTTVRLPDPERILKLYPLELSGGMRQRVLIAMALVNCPRLLIADEPGTALDVTIQAQILKLLKGLVDSAGIAVLLITHDLGVVREIAERVYIMYAGQISESGQVEDVFDDPMHPYTTGLLASVPRLTGGLLAEGIPGSVPDYTEAPPGCRFHPRCPHVMEICSQRKPAMTALSAIRNVACYLHEEVSDE
ncbi:ABC transporter ATP-binding protein [Candidatus Bipolaricaulota bacterium]|nr:ABC transporter ATP-binding protein [Candidatus Bipolaricaulota bacterium]